MFPPVIGADVGFHLGRRGLVGWYGFHSNLFLWRHHRGGGGVWGWNGILIADWPGGGHHRAWLPDHAAIRFRLGPALRPGSGAGVSVPPLVGFGDLPTCRWAGAARGHKAMPP